MEYEKSNQESTELKDTVAEKRKYNVLNVDSARRVATTWLESIDLAEAVNFGLPEIDDRYHVWRVPLVGKDSRQRVGEVVIDAYTSLLLEDKSTSPDVLEARLLRRTNNQKRRSPKKKTYKLSNLRNTIALGDAVEILPDLPAESVDLIFTSPPNYKHEDYIAYDEYLFKMRRVIRSCHRILNEGRFFIINISPTLNRQDSRNESSRRMAVPFDMHQIFIEEGFDFIDDIIWVKPGGDEWATERGRRFAADRSPLQYKPVPVTEYVLVYRKQTKRLIDWNIKSHPNQELVEASKVPDGYETTNIWQIKPAHDKEHPAMFPEELAAKVITYYSFVDDVILDPFAGSGTVGLAATKLKRRFVLIDQEPTYVDLMRNRAKRWLGKEAADVFCMNCPPISVSEMLV